MKVRVAQFAFSSWLFTWTTESLFTKFSVQGDSSFEVFTFNVLPHKFFGTKNSQASSGQIIKILLALKRRHFALASDSQLVTVYFLWWLRVSNAVKKPLIYISLLTSPLITSLFRSGVAQHMALHGFLPSCDRVVMYFVSCAEIRPHRPLYAFVRLLCTNFCYKNF